VREKRRHRLEEGPTRVTPIDSSSSRRADLASRADAFRARLQDNPSKLSSQARSGLAPDKNPSLVQSARCWTFSEPENFGCASTRAPATNGTSLARVSCDSCTGQLRFAQLMCSVIDAQSPSPGNRLARLRLQASACSLFTRESRSAHAYQIPSPAHLVLDRGLLAPRSIRVQQHAGIRERLEPCARPTSVHICQQPHADRGHAR